MAGKRFRRHPFTPIGDVIGQVLRQCRPMDDKALLRVWEVWDMVVGPAVGGHARPVAFKGDMLLVHVSNSTWLHHLRFGQEQLVDALNRALGGAKVRSVKLKIGPI